MFRQLQHVIVKILRGRRNAAKRESHPLRDSGDALRDAQDWLGACDAYRCHLASNPRDREIWIQFGHASKEAGLLDEASDAYQTAKLLGQDDADLLLSMGHLFKLQGDYPQAAQAYAESARLAPTYEVCRELRETRIAFYLSADDVALCDRYTADLRAVIADRCVDLRLLTLTDVLPAASGRLTFVTDDPQLILEPKAIDPDCPALAFVVKVADREDLSQLRGKLYLDFGTGFGAQDWVPVQVVAPGTLAALVIAPTLIRGLRWDPDDQPGALMLVSLRLHSLTDPAAMLEFFGNRLHPTRSASERLITEIYSGVPILSDDALDFANYLVPADDRTGGGALRRFEYAEWIDRYCGFTDADVTAVREMDNARSIKPTFSFVLPTYNTPLNLLRECLQSLLVQTYPYFEICIADDASTHRDVIALLIEYASQDERIHLHLRQQNGHISAASNSALALASGEFVVLVDHDDLVPPYALSVVAEYIARYPAANLFYSDEDKVDLRGRRFEPYFKGNYDRFLMYGHNMVSHLGVYRRSLVEAAGGFRLGFEGSQDYDLALRCIDLAGEATVVHIPHVLYHWRAVAGSTAVSADQKDYAIVAARRSITAHFDRIGLPLSSVEGFATGVSAIATAAHPTNSVSIIIPTRNGVELLSACIASIDVHQPEHVEILVIDNGSDDSAMIAYLAALALRPDATVVRHDAPFNFSEINNVAARAAKGELLCFLNNDTEVIAPGWLNRARMMLAMEDIGVVGARLLYPDGTLQHFGITLGMYRHRVAGTLHSGAAGDQPGYFGKARLIQQFSAITAACMFVRAHDFNRLGGFDPAFKVAYNDVDLCLRFRQAGLRVVCDPEIVLFHKESRSRGSDGAGERAERLDREASLMRHHWADVLDNDPFFSPNLSLDHPNCMLAHPPRVSLPWLVK